MLGRLPCWECSTAGRWVRAEGSGGAQGLRHAGRGQFQVHTRGVARGVLCTAHTYLHTYSSERQQAHTAQFRGTIDHAYGFRFGYAAGASYSGEDSHGTHTSGSAAGALLSSGSGDPVSSTVPDLASGGAPLARLSVLDMGNTLGGYVISSNSDFNNNFLSVR